MIKSSGPLKKIVGFVTALASTPLTAGLAQHVRPVAACPTQGLPRPLRLMVTSEAFRSARAAALLEWPGASEPVAQRQMRYCANFETRTVLADSTWSLVGFLAGERLAAIYAWFLVTGDTVVRLTPIADGRLRSGLDTAAWNHVVARAHPSRSTGHTGSVVDAACALISIARGLYPDDLCAAEQTLSVSREGESIVTELAASGYRLTFSRQWRIIDLREPAWRER